MAARLELSIRKARADKPRLRLSTACWRFPTGGMVITIPASGSMTGAAVESEGIIVSTVMSSGKFPLGQFLR